MSKQVLKTWFFNSKTILVKKQLHLLGLIWRKILC